MGVLSSKLLPWATGAQPHSYLWETVERFPGRMRGWGIYTPTPLSHWLRAAGHSQALPACGGTGKRALVPEKVLR